MTTKEIKNNELKKEEESKADPKVLSFFLLMSPTVLIVALGILLPKGWVMIVIAIYQAILFKQFLDNYYT